MTFVGDNTVLHRLIAGVAASKEIIIGLCVLALCECDIIMISHSQVKHCPRAMM